MERKLLKTEQLIENNGQINGLPENPRSWSRKDLDLLKKSLKETPELFEARGIIVYPFENQYVVMGGNMRLAAARELKMEQVPCIILDESTDISKLKEIVIKDNGSFGAWDYDRLGNEWDDNPLLDWGVPAWEMGNEEEDEQEVMEDNFDEDQEVKQRVSRGDIWLLGEHRLMCGDSTNPDDVKTLMGADLADMVFTDPPYGVSFTGANNPTSKDWDMIANDDLKGDDLYQFLLRAFQNMSTYLKEDGAYYVWFATLNHVIFEKALQEAGLRIKQELVWDKGMVLGRCDYHWAHEPCFYGTHKDKNCKWYGDRTQKTFLAMNRAELKDLKKEEMLKILQNLYDGRTCWKIDKDNRLDYIHPTQKPLKLAGRGIKNSSCAGQIVLDLFSGSGSTMMAAEQLGRIARCMEYDPIYCDKIIARWEKMTGGKAEKLN